MQQGDANYILGNLHAAGRLADMVVVMPDGTIPGSTGLPQDDQFSTEVLDNLVPAVESAYNVYRSRKDRALAGFQLGGLKTLNTVFDAPGAFAGIGDFSSGYFPNVIDQIRAKDPALLRVKAVNKRTDLNVIYIGKPG